MAAHPHSSSAAGAGGSATGGAGAGAAGTGATPPAAGGVLEALSAAMAALAEGRQDRGRAQLGRQLAEEHLASGNAISARKLLLQVRGCGRGRPRWGRGEVVLPSPLW